MKYKVQIILTVMIVLMLASSCRAQTSAPVVTEETKKDFHFTIGGNYSWLNNDYGEWKSLDLSLKYSGFERITPFGSFATLSRKEGSQRVYGFGSYINLHPKFYMIAGISGAPVDNPNVVYYPRLRMDLTGFFKAPILDGFLLTTGFSDISEQSGAGASIISVGGIYHYKKAIFNLSWNYNIARPDNVPSQSVQAGFMYGTQGKYMIGAGGATGKVAYQTVSAVPFDVRYDSRGVYAFYQHWMGKDWGIIGRYDYQDMIGVYNLNGITLTLFIDF
jgi:YaiO family outer membrane protein